MFIISNVFILLYLLGRVMIMSKRSDLDASICQLPSCVRHNYIMLRVYDKDANHNEML
jgi:hypothetical protein